MVNLVYENKDASYATTQIAASSCLVKELYETTKKARPLQGFWALKGSNVIEIIISWWRRGESNSRPQIFHAKRLQV